MAGARQTTGNMENLACTFVQQASTLSHPLTPEDKIEEVFLNAVVR